MLQVVRSSNAISFDIGRIVAALKSSMAWPAFDGFIPDWRRQQEERAADIGIRLPTFLSDAQLAALEAAPDYDVDTYLQSMQSPDAAAADFLAWMRSTGRTGRYTSDELDALYGIHCQETNRPPTPNNVLRKHMHVPGVHRMKDDVKRHGRRSRPTVWVIEETVSSRKLAA